MSSNNRNQRGNFRGEHQNLSDNSRITNRESYRNQMHQEDYPYHAEHAEGSSRFHGRENDDRLRREPSNQWGNNRNYRSSHRGSDFGSGYFGNSGSYYGNYEGGSRSDHDQYENQWYDSPDNRYYSNYTNDQNTNDRDYSPYNRNRSLAHEESNYGRFNRGQDRWGSLHDSYSTSDKINNNRYSRQDDQGGLHRGKGPKGYGRSDERIKEDINDRLSDHSYIDASEVEVSVKSGEVILTGTVEDRISKRRAEDLAEEVSGVSNVENRLRIQKSERVGNIDEFKSTSQAKTPNGVRSKSSLVES